MKRWLVNLLAALSLLLCLATAVMWMRSYWVWQSVAWNSPFEEVPATRYTPHVESDVGGLVLRIWRTTYPAPGDVEEELRPDYLYQIEVERESAGWRYFSGPGSDGSRHGFSFERMEPFENWPGVVEWWILVLPYWFLVALTAALPGFVGWRRWRAAVRGRRIGVCSVCSYDLRASPQRCPECGAGVVVVASPAAGVTPRAARGEPPAA